ncbi:MAG: hypothetical protein ACM3KR_06340 [Deltaproteobacteria bacterium]
MKKTIKRISDVQNPDLNKVPPEKELIFCRKIKKDISSKPEDSSDISLSGIISYAFIIILLISVAYKFVFPTINSLEANLTHKKIGKSIVSSYFNLLENTKYSEALKLIDTNNSKYSVNSLIDSLKTDLGSTDIVGCNIMDVIEDQDSAIVNTVVSCMDNTGKVFKQDKSFLVKNTPEGWKISLNGLIKKFKLQPVSATFSNGFIISLDEIEYCVEGINLKINIKNKTYNEFNINGTISMNMSTGYKFSEPIKSILKSKVNYNHNILFNGSNGEPYEVVIKLEGSNYKPQTLPVKIVR